MNLLEDARKWLDFARNSEEDNTYYIARISECLQKAGAFYEHIDTSEEEIAELLISGYSWAASYWRQEAERNCHKYDVSEMLSCMEMYRIKARESYEELGTSVEEIQEHRINGLKASYLKTLTIIREDGPSHFDLNLLEKRLWQANISYEQIGISEQDIVEWRKKAN